MHQGHARETAPNEILIRPSGCSAVKPQYFRLMDPDLPVAVDEAGNFYEADEYELACLERGCTPFTRKTVNPDAEMATSVPATNPTRRRREKERLGHSQGCGDGSRSRLWRERREKIRPRGDARS